MLKVLLSLGKICSFIAVSIWHSLVKIDGLTLRLIWWACIMHHMDPNLNGTKLDRVGVKIELGTISAVGTTWAHCSLFWMMVKICSSRGQLHKHEFHLYINRHLFIFAKMSLKITQQRSAMVLIAFCFYLWSFIGITSKLLLHANIQRWALWHDLCQRYWQNS